MSEHDVTLLLRAAEKGDSEALNTLLPLVYAELRVLATARMRHAPPGQTLQPTALVHEAYLRLVRRGGNEEPTWADRSHFFLCAAQGMRDILVEHARKRGALKAGGAHRRVDLDAIDPGFEVAAHDLIALDEAIAKLEREEPLRYRIVMLRFFAGLSMVETAAALGMPLRTLEREWRYLRARLSKELGGPVGGKRRGAPGGAGDDARDGAVGTP
jgi:RNA polymerase sigma factor (TIGR02999 family)